MVSEFVAESQIECTMLQAHWLLSSLMVVPAKHPLKDECAFEQICAD